MTTTRVPEDLSHRIKAIHHKIILAENQSRRIGRHPDQLPLHQLTVGRTHLTRLQLRIQDQVRATRPAVPVTNHQDQ